MAAREVTEEVPVTAARVVASLEVLTAFVVDALLLTAAVLALTDATSVVDALCNGCMSLKLKKRVGET